MGDFNRDGGSDRRRSGGFRGRDSGRFSRGRSGGFDRRDRGRDRPSESREMHSAVCDKCGKDCEVPFKPTPGKSIYCNDCFKDKNRESGSRSGFGRPSDGNFDQINEKLNKILKILGATKEPVKEKEQPELKKPKKIEKEKPKKKAKKS